MTDRRVEVHSGYLQPDMALHLVVMLKGCLQRSKHWWQIWDKGIILQYLAWVGRKTVHSWEVKIDDGVTCGLHSWNASPKHYTTGEKSSLSPLQEMLKEQQITHICRALPSCCWRSHAVNLKDLFNGNAILWREMKRVVQLSEAIFEVNVWNLHDILFLWFLKQLSPQLLVPFCIASTNLLRSGLKICSPFCVWVQQETYTNT